MSQVQSSRRVPAIDQRSGVGRAALCAPTEAFQNTFGPQHPIGRIGCQQSFLAHQAALAQEQYWHGQNAALQVLNGEALARLNLEFPSGNCKPYATENIPHRFYQPHQPCFQAINSPVSTSSPISLTSQDSCHTFSTESQPQPFDFEVSNLMRESASRSSPAPQGSFQHGAMVDRRIPPTPQSIEDDPHGMQQLISYNAQTPYAQPIDDGRHPGSGHATAYGSPAPNSWYPDNFDERPDMYQARSELVPRGYEWRGSPNPTYSQPYGVPVYPPPRFGPAISPSPVVSDNSSGMMPAPRVQKPKAEPKRKPKAAKKTSSANRDQARAIGMTEPLSVLTKDYPQPIRDMEEHVNRPAEERLEEMKTRGKIARPMNSFMCYRSAYAERTKQWCHESNHQKISSLSGISWRMETPEIREKYAKLADTEKENHNKAHPGYKFSPAKAKTTDRKRKGAGSEDEDEEEDFEHLESDSEWTPAGYKRTRGSRQRPRREMVYQESSPYMGGMPYPHPYHAAPGMNRSAFHASNPGRPLPVPMEDMQAYGQQRHYYTQSAHSIPSNYGHTQGQIEDIRIHHTPVPQADQAIAPSGLPGANHDDLYALDQNLDQNNIEVYGGGDKDQFVDPSLMNFDQPYQGGVFTEAGFSELDGDIIAQQSQEQGRASQGYKPLVEEGREPWEEPSANTDVDDAFRDWLAKSS